MTNVLPLATRDTVRTLLRSRLLFVGSLMFALAGFVSILALTPAFLTAAIPLLSRPTELSDSAKEQEAIYEENRSQASRTRARIAVLAPFAEEIPKVHSIIERVYALRPSGVSITTMKYEKGKEGQIVITGMSSAREPVNDFRTALVATGLFDSVSVPVAALVGALDGNFSMTLSGKF